MRLQHSAGAIAISSRPYRKCLGFGGPHANLTSLHPLPIFVFCPRDKGMKIVNSLKSLKGRDKNCRIVRRRGRVYIINKANPRYKARQG